MSSFGQTLKSYFWWTYPRGSVPYDVMVTLILAFIFVAPAWVDFRDKPAPHSPQKSEVIVQNLGNGFVYTVNASIVSQGTDAEIRESLMRVLEPIAGDITIDKYQALRDNNHRVTSYRVWAHR